MYVCQEIQTHSASVHRFKNCGYIFASIFVYLCIPVCILNKYIFGMDPTLPFMQCGRHCLQTPFSRKHGDDGLQVFLAG